jgi:hypothetical protein
MNIVPYVKELEKFNALNVFNTLLSKISRYILLKNVLKVVNKTKIAQFQIQIILNYLVKIIAL